jgi:hypothetical protein
VALDRRSRTKALLSGAATVAVLAVVLIALGLMGPLRSKPAVQPSVLPGVSQSAQSDAFYQQAVVAQASGDLTRTAELAQQAVNADPNNAPAKKLLEETKAKISETATPQTPSNTTTRTANPDTAFLTRYSDLRALLATSVAGFQFDPSVQFKRDLTVSGSPVPSDAKITQVAWSVHDMGTVAAAKAFVTNTSKKLFAKDAATVTIRGRTAYFGTDGTRFATISYARGRYAFEVLVTVKSVKPSSVKATTLQAANAFRESPAHQ